MIPFLVAFADHLAKEIPMFNKSTILLALLALCVPAASLTYDCISTEPIICDGIAISQSINAPPEYVFTHCGASSLWLHKAYTLTLTSESIVSLTVAGMAASASTLIVFSGCDQNQCVAQSPTGLPQITTNCLQPGI
jgi:hypothetical protein